MKLKLLILMMLFMTGMALTAAPSTVIMTLGGNGTGNGPYQFYQPQGVAVAGDGKIYVTDRVNQRVQIFASDGSHLQTIGNGEGTGTGQFGNPMQVDVDNDGNIYVVEQNNNRVQIFNPDGSYNRTLTSSFLWPRGLEVDNAGKIYVGDTTNHKVKIFNNNGSLVATFGSWGSGNTQFNQPIGIAVDSDGKIYVADKENHRVQIFNSDRTYLATLGGNGAGNANNQLNLPQGVVVDSSGRIYVADTYNSRIQIFNSDYSYLATITGFWEVYDVEVDSTGKIYAVDYNNNRVQVLEGYPVSPAGVTVSMLSTTITEGDSGDSYEVVLDSQPTADVSITVQSDPAGILSLSVTTLTFTNSDWNTPQIVTLSKADDALVTGPRLVKLLHSVNSTDPEYDNIAVSDVRVTVNDNDALPAETFTVIMTLGGNGTGSANNQFYQPQGVAVAGDGKIYVTDRVSINECKFLTLMVPIFKR